MIRFSVKESQLDRDIVVQTHMILLFIPRINIRNLYLQYILFQVTNLMEKLTSDKIIKLSAVAFSIPYHPRPLHRLHP